MYLTARQICPLDGYQLKFSLTGMFFGPFIGVSLCRNSLVNRSPYFYQLTAGQVAELSACSAWLAWVPISGVGSNPPLINPFVSQRSVREGGGQDAAQFLGEGRSGGRRARPRR